MTDAIQTAIGGMQAAAAKANDAAETVARSNFTTPVATPPTPPSASSPAVINDIGKGQTDDALRGVTEFQQAARAYEASLKAVEALHKVQQTLVEALGWVLPEDPQKAQ